MSGPVAWSLAVQLLLLAGAKWRTRDDRRSTLLGRLTSSGGRELWLAAILLDVAVAGLLVWSAAAAVAAAAVLIVIVVAGVAVELVAGSGEPCGCFGAPHPRARLHARERAAKGLLVLESAAVLFVLGSVPTAVQLIAGLAASVVQMVLVPDVVTAWLPGKPLTRTEAVRRLAAADALGPWRPYLISDIPGNVTVTGRRSADIVLDAWFGSAPMLVVARIAGRRVTVSAKDGQTLEPMSLPEPEDHFHVVSGPRS